MAGVEWARIEGLLERCLELTPEERDEVLEAAPDAEVAARVRRLLELEAGTSKRGFLEPRRVSVSPRLVAERIGPWQVTERIGEGGMGIVFEAQRADGAFDKRVAVKLLKLGLCSEEFEERFHTEVRVLAALSHPGIAALFDAGRTESGQPYLVLELVRGDPIDVACDARELGLSERVELALEVCDAVQYAHERGVLHRDLKPQNILVSKEGRVHLLDFGIAKVEGQLEGLETLQTTLAGQRLYSPRYASPEQIRGEKTGATSDVYSMGVVLYELLVGAPPYTASSTSQFELERAVCDTEAELASRSDGRDASRWTRRGFAQRASLERALAGDLEWILAAALRKDPDRRYATMAELAADLRRYLASLPVRARPETLAYRTRRFISRNPVLVATASILGALLALSAIVAWVGFLEAREEKERSDHMAYVSALEAVVSAFELGDLATAERLLLAQPEASRGWEWRHLVGRLDLAVRRYPVRATLTTGLALSPDGRFMTTSGNGGATVVDVASGATTIVTPHGSSCVAFSPEGELAIGTSSGTVRLHRGPEWSEAQVLEVADIEIESLDYHPDGDGLIVGTYAGELCRVDSAGEVRWRSFVHRAGDLVARFSPDGERIATAPFEEVAKILDAATGTVQHVLEGHTMWVTDVAWTRSGDVLVTTSLDGSVRTWNAGTGEPISVFRPLSGRLNFVRVLPGDEEVLLGHQSGFVLRLSIEEGVIEERTLLSSAGCRSLVLLPDGERFILSDAHGTGLFELGHSSVPVRTVCEFSSPVRFSPSGERVAISGPDGRVRLFSANAEPLGVVQPTPRTSPAVAKPASIAWRGDELVIAELDEGRLTLRSESGEPIRGPEPIESAWLANEEVFSGLEWVESLGLFVSGSARPVVLRDGEGPVPVGGVTGEIYGRVFLAVRPRTSEVAFAYHLAEGGIRLFRIDLATNSTLQAETIDGLGVQVMSYSPDGRLLAIASGSLQVPGLAILDVDSGERRFLELGGVAAVAFHPEDPVIGVGTASEVSIVCLRRGSVLARLRGHEGRVDGLAFSPDGSTLVSIGSLGTARFWVAPDQSSISR